MAFRIPIDNVLTGGDYTVALTVSGGTAGAGTAVNMLLDTGSSMLVVDGAAYDPSTDPNATTTQLLQTANFQSGTFMASVVRTSVGLSPTGAAPVTLHGANLAVTYDNRPGTFGQADGIFGLAYAPLDTAWRMPADTSKNHYQASQLGLGQQADLDPYVSQAAAIGLVSEKFAFVVRRSVTRQVMDDPATDPLNNGLFVLGGGTDCADLYTGAVTSIAVVHQQYYNTNLLAVRLGDRSLNVPPIAPGARVASNSIIDSGAGSLTLDRDLYAKVLAMFTALNPDFGAALQKYAPSAGGGDQTKIDLTRWPPLQLVFQGSDGTPVRVLVAAQNYWQFDSVSRGIATSVLCSDNGMLGGQSNLGLPLFCDQYVVFDRTASNGHGTISFATSTAGGVTATS